jgi:hypothetical protein
VHIAIFGLNQKVKSWTYNFAEGIILRILRLEVSVYNVYIKNQFQTTFAQEDGRRGDKIF